MREKVRGIKKEREKIEEIGVKKRFPSKFLDAVSDQYILIYSDRDAEPT